MDWIQIPSSRRSVLAGAGGLVAATFLSACSATNSSTAPATRERNGEPKRGGVVRLAVSDAGNDPLDPLAANHSWTHFYALMLWDTLVAIDAQWRVTPQLAESWEPNEDATEWTFRLRRGVKFHDGKPLTAADAAYTLKRTLDPALGSGGHARLSASLKPSGIATPDESTLVLSLTRPDSLLTTALAQPYNAVVPEGFDPADATGIGTGPFKLKSWQTGDSFEVVRNENYWEEGLPYLDGVRAVVMPEEASKVQSVISGQQDLADPVGFAAASTVTGDAEILTAESANFFTIAMDSTKEPFTDPRVTEAVKIAADRQKILELAIGGSGTVSIDVPAPPTDPFYPDDLTDEGPQIEEAKRLLAEAGYTEGLEVELHTFAGAAGMVETATAFAEVVKPAGITVKVRQQPGATYYDNTWMQVPMFMAPWGTRHPYDMVTVAYQSKSPWNETKFNSSELDTLLDDVAAEVDETTRGELIEDALRMVAEGASNSIPVFAHRMWPKSVSLKGVDVSPKMRYDILHRAYFE
jgi:peptide/nickel transport system substrate-binding protein